MAESHPHPAGHPTDRFLGTSPAMAALRAQIRHLASFDVVGSPHVPTLLLQGETGTGKGLLARVIHDSGPRAQGPFIAVNCAAIPDTMLEAELFGFEAGAFTDAKRAKPGLFEAASGGTLLLDEVDALPLALQGKLLTVLESRRVRRLGAVTERAVDVKLIAATNAVLSEAVTAGRFRADLYHRLAVLVLALPPLRERGEDVLVLAQTFLQHYTAAHGVPPKRLSAAAEAWLQAYAWPGNVRELSHAMERVTLLHMEAEVDTPTLMHLCQPQTPPATGHEAAMAPQERERASAEPAEAAQIRQALAQTGGNVAGAARLLGVSRDTVRYRMQRYGLARPRSAAAPPPETAAPPVPLHAPEAGFSGPSAPGEGQKGYASADRAEEPTQPHTRRGRKQPSSEAMASQRVRHDVTIAPDIAAAEAAWEQKPVAVLALEVTWPEATGPGSLRYDPWTEQVRWQQAIVDKVQGFGGVLLQRTPALLTWVFGLPQTLEQLPQRAVHSALAIRQMVADARASDLAVSPEVRLAVHLGAVRWDGRADARMVSLLAVGDTMARPVRLLAQAGAGEVVVSSEVRRLVEGLVALEMRVGGYAILGVSHGRTALASGGAPVRSPFVGRAREFALLEAVLEQVQAGQGQVVGLMGAPGIGKSRLLEEFRRSLADKRVTYLEARCLAYRSAIPYLPVRDLLQDNCGISETDSHEAMAEKVRLVLQEVGMDPEEGEPYLLHLLGVPLGTERFASLHPKALKARTFEILQELNVHGSRRQPLILAVEDLQWIDPTSEEFLASLVERIGSAPILLLATYRPEYRPPWMGKSYVSQLALSPLAAQDSLCLVRAVLQTAQVPAALEQLLLAKAEGNPFFLEELLQGMLEQGVVVREAGGLGQLADRPHAPPMTAIPLPPTVQAVLAARIDRLPPAAKRLLQMAAVVGMEVPFALLGAMAQLPEEALRCGLAALYAAEFLYETRFFPERAYTFKHALTREVAYRSLLPARRQALHEAIGSAIEALYPERVDEQCELLAHHFSRSGNAAKAIHYLAISGQRAVRLFAYEQAVAFFQEALGRIEGLSDREALRRKEVEILHDLELVYDNLARRDEQWRLLEQLIHAAQALDDPEILSDAYIRRSEFLSIGGAVEDALAEAMRALTLKRQVGDQRGEAKALRAMGFIYWQLRRYEDALRTHRQALEVHREVGDRVAASVELFNLGEILRQLQRYQEALRCLEEARQLLSALEDPLGLALCYYNIGNVYRDLGEYATALRYYQETLASRLQQPHGTSTLWCAPFMGIAMIQSQLGDHREALKYYREALAISQRLGDHRDMVATLPPLAATHEILGEVSDALAYYQQALALSRELGDRHAERSILTSLGHLYRRQLRDFPAALASYRQSLAIDREIGDGDGRLTLLKGLGATCWNLGLYEEAASAFEQALVIVETNGDRAEQAVIRSSLGVSALSLHRYATALTHLQEGLTIAKALEDPRAEGYILNALGNVYSEVGDQRRAKDCYQQAIQLRRRIRDRKGEGWSLHYLGRSHAEVGEVEEARRLQEQALNLADEIGDAELQVGAKLALAAVHCHLGGRGAAKTSLRYAQQAVELSRVNGLHREESVGLSHHAMALLLLSQVEAARACSEEAVQRLEEAGGPAGQRERIWLHQAQVLRAGSRSLPMAISGEPMRA